MPSATATSGLAGRYATALFDLAREDEALDQVAGDLEGLSDALDESSELRKLIRSPILSREQQRRGILAVAEKAGLHALTRKFLGLLADKRRLFVLPEITRTFRTMLSSHRNEITAEVVSAYELKDEQRQALEETIGRFARQHEGEGKVNIETRVDPELLGGLIVRVGSRMLDASLRAKLANLENALRGAA